MSRARQAYEGGGSWFPVALTPRVRTFIASGQGWSQAEDLQNGDSPLSFPGGVAFKPAPQDLHDRSTWKISDSQRGGRQMMDRFSGAILVGRTKDCYDPLRL